MSSPRKEYLLTSVKARKGGRRNRKSDGFVVPMKGRTKERELWRSYWREGILGKINLNKETYEYNRDS